MVGTGTLGMFAVQFLAAGSPAELLVVGTRPDREELSLAFGATTSAPADELATPRTDFDVVIETAGSAVRRADAPPRCCGAAGGWC